MNSFSFRARRTGLALLQSQRTVVPFPQRRFTPFHTAARLLKKSEDKGQDEKQGEKHRDGKKPPRASPGKTSLRRVSLEAERTRLIINKSGRRFIDPDAERKKVTAFCAAEQYDINIASRLIHEAGFELDPFKTRLYPQVVHVQTPVSPSNRDEKHGDVFIFPSGTVVAWNVPDRIALQFVERILPPAALNSHSGFVEVESEDLEYLEDASKDRCDIVGDTIVIGTKPTTLNSEIAEPVAPQKQTEPEAILPAEVDAILAKIAFSSGLARSTKLAVLERLTDTYFESTRSIPLTLSRGSPLPIARPRFVRRMLEALGFGSRLPFTRSFILRKTGELLNIRAQLNLYSELTDSLPDLFWDSRHELGLEGYYDIVGRALDVGVRIKVLNEKMDYAQEIASVLRETLSERHNLRLEWGIIILIAIEVVFELEKRLTEHNNQEELKHLEALIAQPRTADASLGLDSKS